MLTGAERGSVHPRELPDAIRRLATLLSADVLAASPVVCAALTLVVLLLIIAACGSGGREFEAKIALRYATPEGRTVLLEVAPLEVGDNRLRVTVLDSGEHPVAAANGRQADALAAQSPPYGVRHVAAPYGATALG